MILEFSNRLTGEAQLDGKPVVISNLSIDYNPMAYSSFMHGMSAKFTFSVEIPPESMPDFRVLVPGFQPSQPDRRIELSL